FRLNADAAVDHRNKVGISDEVQDVTWPGAIHTAKQNIAIKGCPKALLLNNTPFERFNDERLRCCAPPQGVCENRDLGPPAPRTEWHHLRRYFCGAVRSQNRALHAPSVPSVNPTSGRPVAPSAAAACPCSATTSSRLISCQPGPSWL